MKARELKVGDLIEIKDNATIPADCIILNTMNTKGEAYVSVINLEGSLDLQHKKTHMFIKNNFPRIFCRDPDYKLKIEMDQIDGNVAQFNGRVSVDFEGFFLARPRVSKYTPSSRESSCVPTTAHPSRG